jgi:hypothetical protein
MGLGNTVELMYLAFPLVSKTLDAVDVVPGLSFSYPLSARDGALSV